MSNVKNVSGRKMVECENGVWREACVCGDCTEVGQYISRVPGIELIAYCADHLRQRIADLSKGRAEPQFDGELRGWSNVLAQHVAKNPPPAN